MNHANKSEKPFDADCDFNEQRTYAQRFITGHSYFVDWLIAIYWEIIGKTSPHEYATRVCIAEKIVKNTNINHIVAAQRSLSRVVRNLFPYDKVIDNLPPKLVPILGSSRGKFAKPLFRPLNDSAIRNQELVTLRYQLLGQAFCSEAQCQLTLIRQAAEDEEVPNFMNLANNRIAHAADDFAELKRLRETYYLNFPEEYMRSVNDTHLSHTNSYKRRAELPKDTEPELLANQLSKYETTIRSKLQAIIIDAKSIYADIEARKKVYQESVNDVLHISGSIQEFVQEGPYDKIQEDAEALLKVIEDKFDQKNYLPADVLKDLKDGNILYLNGLI